MNQATKWWHKKNCTNFVSGFHCALKQMCGRMNYTGISNWTWCVSCQPVVCWSLAGLELHRGCPVWPSSCKPWVGWAGNILLQVQAPLQSWSSWLQGSQWDSNWPCWVPEANWQLAACWELLPVQEEPEIMMLLSVAMQLPLLQQVSHNWDLIPKLHVLPCKCVMVGGTVVGITG